MKRFVNLRPVAAILLFLFGVRQLASSAEHRNYSGTPYVAVRGPLDAEEPEPAEPASDDSPAAIVATDDSDNKSDDDAESTKDEEKPSAGKDEAEEKTEKSDKASAKDEEKPAAGSDKKDEKASAKKEAKKRKTYKVKTKRLKIDVPLDGAFVARKMEEVPLRPESWSDYEIVEVVPLGTKVREGEVLFKFDDRKIKETIADLELDQRLSELSLRRDEEDLPRLEKTIAMNYDDAERSDRETKEDFEHYNKIDRDMILRSADYLVKVYQYMLDYEQDELNELEKMYKADDLTEATEEIVLKRQRDSVEMAKFNFERAKLSRDQTVNVRVPRYDIQIKQLLERSALDLAKAKLSSTLDPTRARYELEQRKQSRSKSLERHAKLLGDRALMEIKSPAEGIVYYGQCVNGRWSDTASLINKYRPHNNVSPNSILMTIVDPRPLTVTAMVDEAKRPDVAEKQQAKIATPLEGSDRITGHVKSISPIPVSPGKFEVNLELEQNQVPEWVVAGMTCKVKVNTYDKADAIVVPKGAVHADDQDEDQQYVWLVDPDDAEAKPERRNVKVGKRSSDDVEIVKGLKVGEVISLDDESDKEKDGDKAKEKE